MVNIIQAKQEQVVFLRNSDIFTIEQRGVTTADATGTLAGTDTITITTPGVKNIRSVTVDAVPKYVGIDYTVAYPHKAVTDTVITFLANQTGDYSVIHDYGADKIYPDFPRDDLTISSYPRISVDILNAPMDPFGIGGESFISNVAMTIVAYSDNSDDLDLYIQTIKDLYVANAKNFFYLNFVKVTLLGPTINSPDKKDEIMQKNIDILGMFNVESA